MPWSGTDTMLAEFQGRERVFPIVKMTLGDDVIRIATQAVASASKGMYVSHLRSMSGFRREAFDRDFALSIPTPSISVKDEDRVIQKIIGGPLKGKARFSPVEIWWLPETDTGIGSADHYEDFDGVVTNYGHVGDREWSFELSLKSADVLNGKPKIPILGIDFPTAPAKFRNEPLWIIYGKHASLGITDAAGMVKALPAAVDAAGVSLDWVLSFGQLQIQRLYRNGVEETASWGFYVLERGTHRYQMARYSGGSNPTPDDTITFDCWGLFTTAPATASAPIENPASCIRNFLANFVFGSADLRAGSAWESETGKPIATAVLDLAATYFSARGEVMGKVIRADETVIDVFNGWCKSTRSVPLFTDAWAIGAIPEDEGELGIYQNDRHMAQALGYILDSQNKPAGSVSMSTSRSKPVSEILASFLHNDATSSLTDSILVADPSQTTTVREAFDIEYGDTSIIDL